MLARSPVLCIFCGAEITPRRDRSWLREFRAIRWSNESTSSSSSSLMPAEGGPVLTGVGSSSVMNDMIDTPWNPSTRWDDADNAGGGAGAHHNNEDEESFPPLIGVRTHKRPGFLFHEHCWQLIGKMAAPRAIPVDRLYDLCLSFPVNAKIRWVDWGHDYGGIMNRLPVRRYPWEHVYVVGLIRRYLGSQEGSPLHYYMADPLDVPDVGDVLRAESSESSSERSEGDGISPILREHEDCFARLPEELREQILILLPSQSVVKLRLAARSFASYRLNRRFWASRFGESGERAHIYEAKELVNGNRSSHRSRDWETLYMRTSTTAIPAKEMKNRKRIWDCNLELIDVLLEEPLTDLDSAHRSEDRLPEEQPGSWRSVGGEFTSSFSSPSSSVMTRQPIFYNSNLSPCKSIWEQTVSIPADLKDIAVSVRAFGGRRYVCGIRFVSDKGEDVIVGYVLPRTEVHLNSAGALLNEDGGEFSGLVTAVGPAGIHAIRATSTSGNSSRWAGDPDGFPVTLRLCMGERIQTLRACFDGIKLVFLGIPADSELSRPDGEHLTLRRTAIWYPSIPARHLQMYEESFAGRRATLGNDCRPLVHVMFGGPEGKYLPHLVRISAVVSKAAIVGIDFYYSPAGGRDEVPECIQSCPSMSTADDTVDNWFSIDGPAGERLTSIRADGDAGFRLLGGASKSGFISSLKVTTSWGRHCVFQPSAVPVFKLPSRPSMNERSKRLEITAGDTITGLYYMHDPKCGMITLSPISEELKNKSGRVLQSEELAGSGSRQGVNTLDTTLEELIAVAAI